ncbi:MAG: FHA domain-containing protein [Lachnobacterium sp.]|nr:FHA domain-containing protein [Lachnobacterium sp.]
MSDFLQEVSFFKTPTKSFMKIRADECEKIDEYLLLNKKIAKILPCQKNYNDGIAEYWYDITGMQSFDKYCKIQKVDIKLYKELVQKILRQVDILEKNLINIDAFVLNPKYIYVDDKEIFFTIYPPKQTSFLQEFRMLIENFMNNISHEDKEIVDFIYGLYEKIGKDENCFRQIQKYVMEYKNREYLEKSTYTQSSIYVDMSERINSKSDKPVYSANSTDLKHYEIQEEYEAPPQGIIQENTPQKQGPFKDSFIKKLQSKINEGKRVVNDFLGISNDETYEENNSRIYEEYEESFDLKSQSKKNGWKIPDNVFSNITNPLKKTGRAKKDEKNNKKNEILTPVIYPELDYDTENEGDYETFETVCLGNSSDNISGTFIYEGIDDIKDFYVEKKSVIIGNSPNADVFIKKNTVSKMHCQITRDEAEYFVEDLNSKNGTLINGEPLEYQKKYRLKRNDVLLIANVKYRVM